MAIPWGEAATVDFYRGGLHRQESVFNGDLRDAVKYALSQKNKDGDGYIVRLADGSQKWEGAAIMELGRELSQDF